jgi:acetolactate synthase I/III small subunit
MSERTLIALLHDRPGVLHQTVTLIQRLGYNIASLAAGRSEVPGVSRMTLVVDAADAAALARQLDRLPEVLGVSDVTRDGAIQREAALATLSVAPERMAAVLDWATAEGARVIDVSDTELMLEVMDTPERVDQLILGMRAHGLTELMRTGRLAMMRRTPVARPAPTPTPLQPEPPRQVSPPPAPRRADSSPHFRAQADGASSDEAAA